MTKDEAILAMLEGKKVTHRYFTDDEYVFMIDPKTYQFADGLRCSADEFWKYRQEKSFEKDWEIYLTN